MPGSHTDTPETGTMPLDDGDPTTPWNTTKLEVRKMRHAVRIEAVGQADPAQEADGGAVDAGLAQPEAQGAEHQQQRQSRREAQGQHAQRRRFEIHLERFAPRQGRGGFVSRWCGHRVCEWAAAHYRTGSLRPAPAMDRLRGRHHSATDWHVICI